ncbi:Di-and tricarboxylate transporter [Loktanella fryxellensis]|uniref:Di-and tricarboxylate transporter n=1 Tax=Loktanella fryxellensis TaxID=245187 RepID=A0A1H8C6Q0_9RHOB|nr:SLC13 family permease [Loktanella fryxellensis]SEM89948.1 Di-and tricarboxylate transporter [Loktanella fryxellensis]
MLGRATAGTVLCAAAGLLALLTCLATPDPALRVLAIACAGIGAFATRTLPEVVTALAIFLAFLAGGVAPEGVIFSGFASSGFWLLVGGLVIGSAITVSGLGDRIAQALFRMTGPSYVRAVLLLSGGGLLLGAMVPSAIPRVIVLMPVTLALAQRMGLPTGSRAHTGLLMTSALMTLVPTYAFLTANLPTIVEFGILEILYDVRYGYGGYFVQNAPINALRFAVLLALLLAWGRGSVPTAPPAAGPAAAWTPAQRRLSVVLGLATVLWATDSLHGIAPAWVTLAAAGVLLLPGLGVFSAQAMKTEVDLSIAILIAAVFGIGAVMSHVGLGTRIADLVVPVLRLSPGADLWNLSAITLFASALSHLTIAPAAPIVLAPLAAGTADAAGWSIAAVGLAHNIGLSTVVLPYQSPPLLIGIAIAAIPVGPLTRICMLSALIGTVLGLPLTALWWGWTGLL